MKRIFRLLVAVVPLMAGLQLVACGGTADKTIKIEAAHVEPVDGTELSRVILSERAAERLDIQMAPVRGEELLRKRSVGAQVVDPPGTEVQDQNAFWVRVQLSPGELKAVDLRQAVVVFPLSGGQGGSSGLTADDIEAAANGSEESAGVVYFSGQSAAISLIPGQPVLVELTLSGGQRTVIPYSAVIYDQRGGTWTYTNPEPLVFVRQAISIEYIDGDLAVLLDGPPAGTEVVTVGAAELFGVENGVGGD